MKYRPSLEYRLMMTYLAPMGADEIVLTVVILSSAIVAVVMMVADYLL